MLHNKENSPEMEIENLFKAQQSKLINLTQELKQKNTILKAVQKASSHKKGAKLTMKAMKAGVQDLKTSQNNFRNYLQDLKNSATSLQQANLKTDKNLERKLAKFGTLDKDWLVSKKPDETPFYVVHKPNGNILFVTCGLSTLTETDKLELLAEAKESELGKDLAKSWLYQCLKNISGTAKRNITQLSRQIKEKHYATMEVEDVGLPVAFSDPNTKRSCMFLGIEPYLVPNAYRDCNGNLVNIITTRLLTLEQWRASQEFSLGKEKLAKKFTTTKKHHISTLIAEQAKIELANTYQELKPNSTWTVNKLINNVIFSCHQHYSELSSSVIDQLKEIYPHNASVHVINYTEKLNRMRLSNLLSGDISMIQIELIPDLNNPLDYEPPVTSGVILNSFSKTEAAYIYSMIDIEMYKTISPHSHPNEKLKEIADRILSLLARHSHLYGWTHATECIRNPKLYLQKCNANTQLELPNPLPPRGPLNLIEKVNLLTEMANTLVIQYIYKVDFLFTIFRRENKQFHPSFILEALATDKTWMKKIEMFLKNCEIWEEELVAANQERYNFFRALNAKRGVPWPHSPILRKEIEKNGFAFKPMSIKRDRCICDVCGSEVSGWRPWHNPRLLHDYDKHISTNYRSILTHYWPDWKIDIIFKQNANSVEILSLDKASLENKSLVTNNLFGTFDAIYSLLKNSIFLNYPTLSSLVFNYLFDYDSSLPGFEILIWSHKKDLGNDISESGLYKCLVSAAAVIQNNPNKFQNALKNKEDTIVEAGEKQLMLEFKSNAYPYFFKDQKPINLVKATLSEAKPTLS